MAQKDDLYDALRRGSGGGSGSKYGFSGNLQRKTSGGQQKTSKDAPGQVVNYARTPEGDRPLPETRRDERGEVDVDSRPTMTEILLDLGLRAAEMAIAAVAQEVVYYFSKRRFFYRRPKDE